MKLVILSEFEKFQLAIMAKEKRLLKCRLCTFNEAHMPTYKNNKCHQCANEWLTNREED